MNDPNSSEEALLNEALARPAAERAAFLDQACGDNHELRARLAALLAAHDAPGTTLGSSALRPATHLDERIGTRIGHYKLLQKLGEGGCGTVYLAEQEEPVRRRVAVKVIKLGMDTKEVIARFEAERQALAMMDHPNIAKVFDAGTTESGRPYFVMELVQGVPITAFCDERKLSTTARLELFTQVCHAVQHAHQKGVIHRDIKPSNILVALHDDLPVPKVIDFGIAKATGGRLTDQTLFTAVEQFMGTPAYMSPEQAKLSVVDIDTRSDVYSLGVLLYELLTGRTPFDAAELLKIGIDEMRRHIREIDPPRPSTRLSTLQGAALSATAQFRQIAPPKLITLIRGDLDWIVMRCLEKDRARRYETANGLATDLQRHLAHEPVLASPPSASYRLGKMIRRNQLAFAAAGAVAAALVIGFGVSTWAFVKERAARERAVAAEREQTVQRQHAEAARTEEARQRALAEIARERAVAAEVEQSRLREQAEAARNNEAAQRTLAESARNEEVKHRVLAEEARNNEAKQRLQAEANEKKARSEAAKSEQAFKFMAGMLQGVGPSVAAGRDTTLLREILDKTVKRLDKTMKDQPEVEATLRSILGAVYLDLGDAAKAEAMAIDALAISEKLHGREHEDVAVALTVLGLVRATQRRGAEAETLVREALDILRKLPGDKNKDIAEVLFVLGMAQLAQTFLTEAEASLREALALARKHADPDDETIDGILMMLGTVLQVKGRLADAEPLIREALAAQRKRNGDEHPVVAMSSMMLASVLQEQGKLAEAETVLIEAYRVLRKAYGEEHHVVTVMAILHATLAERMGKFADAETLCRETLTVQKKVLGPEHPDLAGPLQMLARLLQRRGQTAEAEKLRREAEAIEKKLLASPALVAAKEKKREADTAMEQGKWAQAEKSLRELLTMAAKDLERTSGLFAVQMLLADAISRQGRNAEAEKVAREALATGRRAFGNNSTHVANVLLELARSLEAQHKLAETESSLREMLAISKTFTTDGENARVADAMLLLATIRARLGDPAEASTLVKSAAAISRKLPDKLQGLALDSAYTMRATLSRQGKHAEAETVERTMLAFLIARDGHDGNPLAQVLVRLAETLNKTGQFAEAETLAREGWELLKKLRPATDQMVAIARSVLGQSLLGVKKYAEAEAALIGAFADTQKNASDATSAPASWRGRQRQNTASLVQLYKATNQPAKAAEWKQKEAALTKAAAGRTAASSGDSELAALTARDNQLKQQGKYAEAEAIERQIIALAITREGQDSRLAATNKHNLAGTLNREAKFAEGELFAREALAFREKDLPAGHWNIVNTRSLLGASLAGQNKFAEAEPVLLRTYADLQAVAPTTPASSRARLATAAMLALLYEKNAQPEKAAEWKLKAGPDAMSAAAAKAKSGDPDLAALTAEDDRLKKQGKLTEAEAVERQMLQLAIARDGRESTLVANHLVKLAQTLSQIGKFSEAEELARERLRLREKLEAPGHWNIASARQAVGSILLAQKRFAEAEPLLLRAYTDLLAVESSIPAIYKSRIAATAALLAQLYEATGQTEKAADWKRKAAERTLAK